MHGVRTALLREQCDALGLPLIPVRIPPAASNDIYETEMRAALARCRAEGVEGVVFGDLFLQDIRGYRERLLEGSGLEPLFPLWLADTRALADAFIDEEHRAVMVCVDPRQIDKSFAGREYDRALLSDLPPTADPCGENGEFHTFVYAGPCFRRPIAIRRGEVVERDGFVFCDLTAAT
jgi:uncharacterized protein (TIGR00290 family)